MDILNSNFKIKKHIVHKKYKLLVEITFKDNEFIISQKLNSFFGQIGIYEGGDKLIKFVEVYFKSIYLEFLSYNEDLIEEEEMILNLENKNSIFFLPVILYFYYGDKKCDFYIKNVFNKKYYLDKKTVGLVFDFLKYKQWYNAFISKNFYFYKMNEYFFLIFNFKNLFKISKSFYSLINLKSIDFLIDDDKNYNFDEELAIHKRGRKRRILFFKKILSKSKTDLICIFKKINSFSMKFVLNIVIHKFFFIKFLYKHSSFFTQISNLFAQIYSMKNKFFYKFRRYKKFKKVVCRNFFGKKISYFKIYRYEDKSKKNAKKR